MNASGGTHSTRAPHIRLRNSLVFRVVFLCAVLLLCLLGMVYGITSHYYGEALNEMQEQTREIANSIGFKLRMNPDEDLRRLAPLYEDQGRVVELSEVTSDEDIPARVSIHIEEDGNIVKEAGQIIRVNNRRILLATRVSLTPQTAILEAFRNSYLLALTGGFVVTLFLMVYVIRTTLRPLGELSDSCARITAGQLEPVEIRNSSGEVAALERTFNDMVLSLREKESMAAKLRQAQRLSALGNMAAGVAHDVRNPLNAIKLLASHAIDSLPPESGATARHLNTIADEVNRLEKIVSGFLSLAKERELAFEPCPVDELLTEAIRLIRADAERRGIYLQPDLKANGAVLLLDRKQFPRAVLNVLFNAMEACAPGARVRLLSRVEDDACVIEVRDDGPGLTAEAADRAFEPYYTTKSTGTGLGLAITRGIIEEHGGSINLHSREGEGCRAVISLPLDQAP